MREYPDQPAAAQARSRLASIAQQEHPAAPTTMTVQKIENFEFENFGSMDADDTDGVRGVYWDSNGNLPCAPGAAPVHSGMVCGVPAMFAS